MPVFLVCSETDRPDLENKVKEEFEDKHYVLRTDSQWLIDADKTTDEVSEKLGIKEGAFGGVVVFLTTNNWGYYRSTLWEWMELD